MYSVLNYIEDMTCYHFGQYVKKGRAILCLGTSNWGSRAQILYITILNKIFILFFSGIPKIIV